MGQPILKRANASRPSNAPPPAFLSARCCYSRQKCRSIDTARQAEKRLRAGDAVVTAHPGFGIQEHLIASPDLYNPVHDSLH
jgi:hypothetical protein